MKYIKELGDLYGDVWWLDMYKVRRVSKEQGEVHKWLFKLKPSVCSCWRSPLPSQTTMLTSLSAVYLARKIISAFGNGIFSEGTRRS